jgi:ankyrin repeat protein
MFAASSGSGRVVSLLLEAGAHINAINNAGYTALIFAASRGHFKVMDLLVKFGADLDVRDKLGRTAMDHCIAERRQESIELLFASGAQLPRGGYRVGAEVIERRKLTLAIKHEQDYRQSVLQRQQSSH